MKKEDELDEDAPSGALEEERDALNRAVLAPLGLVDKLDEVKQAVEKLVKMRERGAGDTTQVLVERERGEHEVIELEGVSKARKSMTLNDFE